MPAALPTKTPSKPHPISFWRYYRTITKEAGKEAVWARDNLMFASLPTALVALITYFVYRQSPDWKVLVATCWVFGTSLLMYVFAILCRAAWKVHNRQQEIIQEQQTETTLNQALSGNSGDGFLSLLEKRQRLEAELQPLLEIEEAGIKVIQAMKIGKDESDYRKERIDRLRRDIEEVGVEISARRQSHEPNSGWRAERSNEKLRLEDELAVLENELRVAGLFPSLDGVFGEAFGGKTTLLRDKIARRKKLIKQLEDDLRR